MRSMERTLDLDDAIAYLHNFDKILYAQHVWPKLEDDFHGNCQMLQELLNDPANIRTPFLKDIQKQCEEEFKRKYDNLVAYHARRTTDSTSYLRSGLLTSSSGRLESLAKEIFAGIGNLEQALEEASVYFLTYDESISMYLSAKFAATEYLNNGSHYLRMVVANLNAEAQQRLDRDRARARPVFVKCIIPIFWLKDPAIIKNYNFLYRYIASLMRRCIWAKASSEKYTESPEVLVVFKSVPPENIVSVLEAEVCLNWIK